MHRLQELVRLHRLQTSARQCARLLGMSRNTERDYRQKLAAAELLDGRADELPSPEELRAAVGPATGPPRQSSSLVKWTEKVTLLVEHGAGPQAIYDSLKRTEESFGGSLSAVKRLVASIKKARGVQPGDVAIPVETAPGNVAQVDFGYVGKLLDPDVGYARKAYVFVLVLGFSRHMFVRLVFDQKIETWLQLHVEAFAELGGVPEVLVPDNLKAAVIRAAFAVDDETQLNKSYIELARHYGFKVDPTPPRAPEKKGKVESGVKYVKNNFFKTCLDEDATLIRPQLQQWVMETAGVRIHGTTQRRPLEVFVEEERAAMLPLPERRYELIVWKRAKVHRDAHVQVAKALYSVPWHLVGETVDVRATPKSLALFFNDLRVATHERVSPGQRCTDERHIPEQRRHLRKRSRAEWESNAAAIGPDVLTWVQEAFDIDDVLYRLRVVANTVRMLGEHPPERANNACRRASFFGNYTYAGVRDILRKALDYEPLPEVLHDEDDGAIHNPRFKRNIAELMELPFEVNNEPN